MTDEDRTAAKLRGHNCMIKFKDGEELYVHVPDLDDPDREIDWLISVELFLNNISSETSPIPGVAVARDGVKYIAKI